MFGKTLQFSGRKYVKSVSVILKQNRQFSPSAISLQKDSLDNDIDTIIVDKDESITLIGINRPKYRNAITFETAEKLSNAISQFDADDTSPIAVLYGVGGTFCAGYDIQQLESQFEQESLDFLLRREGSVGPTRRHTRKPIVCGISGYCVAGGLELALMCDLRVMEESAILGFFNRRFGVPTSDGGTVRLGSIVGYSRALELLESGRRVGGKEALSIGLVNRLVATGTALGQAVNLAFSIAKFPQISLANDRNSMYTNTYSRKRFRAAIQTEIMNTTREGLTEMKEGIQRFKTSDPKMSKEKPVPEWEKREIEFENETKTKT